MNHAPLALCAVFGLSALATPGLAQSGGGEGGLVTSGGMLQGRQERQFEGEISASAAHDSNLSRGAAATAATRNVTPSDWTYTPEGTVSLIQPLGRQVLFLNATAGYRFYDKNRQLDRVVYSGSGGGGASVGPCGAVIGGVLQQSAGNVDTDIVDVFVQNVRKNRQVNVGVTCVQSSGLGVVAGVSKSWVKSSLQQARISDSDTSTVNVGVLYGRPEIAAVTLFGAYARTLYPNRLTVDSTRNGFETRSGGVQVVRKLGARIEASAGFGYTSVKPVGGRLIGATSLAQEEFNGLTYGGEINYRASSRMVLAANFDRSVSPTLVSTGSFQVGTSYGASLEYKMGSRINVGLFAQSKDLNINGVGVATAASTLTNSNTKVGGVSIAYKQSERLSFGLSAERQKRTSDNAMFNYTNDRIVISTAVSF